MLLKIGKENSPKPGISKGRKKYSEKRSPNLRDKNGATIPTKIGQMENEDDRRRAWIMFTQNNGDVNIEDMNKQTAIFHTKNARETNHIANMGANLDHRDKNGDTALHNAKRAQKILQNHKP